VSSSRVPDAEADWLARRFGRGISVLESNTSHEQIVGQAMMRLLVHATPTTDLSRGAQPRLDEEVEKSG
jgi:hypothetical protein